MPSEDINKGGKITFVNFCSLVNSQLENTNLKENFVLQNRFQTFVLKISGIQYLLLYHFCSVLGSKRLCYRLEIRVYGG